MGERFQSSYINVEKVQNGFIFNSSNGDCRVILTIDEVMILVKEELEKTE